MGSAFLSPCSSCIAPQEKIDRKKNVLCSQHVKCNQILNTVEPRFKDTPLKIQTPCSGLSKVAGCQCQINAYLVSISWLLCLASLYGWRFLNKISLDWPITLTTGLSTSKLSDNPAHYYGQFSSSLGKALKFSPNSTRLIRTAVNVNKGYLFLEVYRSRQHNVGNVCITVS